jgi:hypothetical protein
VLDVLQKQLLTRERKLDSREGAIIVWKDGLAASEHAFGRASMERDAECVQVEVVRLDYLSRTRTFTSASKHSINFSRTLEERHILLSLQETDLEVREAKLEEEQARNLHSFIERDLPVELAE